MVSEYLHIADLIRKELDGTISLHERAEIERWLDADPHNADFYRQLTEESDFGRVLDEFRAASRLSDFEDFARRTGIRRTNRLLRLRKRVGVAAAVVLPLALLLTLVSRPGRPSGGDEEPILHRSSTAMLVLSDGRSYSLSDTTGYLPEGTALKVDEESAVLSYRQEPEGEPGLPEKKPVVNRLIVPRGSDYSLELSDGTVVWLGADSEIEYPDIFSDSVREVTLKGLAYFKVARDERHPFIVRTSRSSVRVLGTEFCVSDQNGAVSRTTLVSGRVAVRDMHGSDLLLMPGQQACITAQGSQVTDVETFYYTSWKDGYFMFRENSLREIMEELSEWYDFDYIFSVPELERIEISARLKKYESIDPVLELLGGMDRIAFERDGRTITVVKK